MLAEECPATIKDIFKVSFKKSLSIHMPYKHVVHLYSSINVKTLVVKETCLRIKEKMDDTMNA